MRDKYNTASALITEDTGEGEKLVITFVAFPRLKNIKSLIFFCFGVYNFFIDLLA
jgi:hypothetical protein